MKASHIATIVTFILFVFFIGYMARGPVTGKVVSEQKTAAPVQQEVIDMKPDVVNVEQGTIVAWSSENLDAKGTGLVEFFSSRKIKGLFIRYNIGEHKLIAGLPNLISEKPVGFEGTRHTIAYTYNSLEGVQRLFFDKDIVAEGKYTGVQDQAPIGMVTSYPAEQIPTDLQFLPDTLELDKLVEFEK